MLRSASVLIRKATPINVSRRTFSSGLSKAESDAAMKEANEKMKAYYTNRPPIAKIINSKRRSKTRDREHYVQALVFGSFLGSLALAAFLGKKIATDANFRNTFIPDWYNFSVTQPKSAWTRAELHEQMVQVQRELHERAIRGEFSKEKLDSLRRHFEGVDPDDDEHGWGRLHPGVEDDEDLED